MCGKLEMSNKFAAFWFAFEKYIPKNENNS